MNNSMKALLYAIKHGKHIDCRILDFPIARELCLIYNSAKENFHGNLYHFLSYIRERHGGTYSLVLEKSVEEFEDFSEEEFEGLIKFLTTLAKERVITDFILSVKDGNPENIDKILREMQHVLDEVNSFSNSEKVLEVSGLIDEILQDIKEKQQNPGIPGVSTGYKSLDEKIGGYREGNLIYIGGRPSQGKSAFAINSALRVAEKHPVLIISREMTAKQIMIRMISILSGVPIIKMEFGIGLSDSDLERIKEAASYIKKLPIYLDEDFSRPFYSVLDNIKKHVDEFGVRVVFVDYIQLLAERSSDSVHELGRISRGLKLVANEKNITVVCLSQLNREVEKRDDKRPKASDLRQSGNMEEDGDIVAFIYRDEVYNPDSPLKGKMEFIIEKNRPNGILGTVLLNFDSNVYRITEE